MVLNHRVFTMYQELEFIRNYNTTFSKIILTDDEFLQLVVSNVFYFNPLNEDIMLTFYKYLTNYLDSIVLYIYVKFIIYLISQIILSIIFNFQMIPAISKNLNNLNRSGLVLKGEIFKKIAF